MATRGEIKRNIRLKCGESSQSMAETLLLDELIDQAVDKVARADAWYTYFDADLVGTAEAPQSLICLPSAGYGTIYKIKSARVWDGGAWRIYRQGRDIVTPSWMDHNRPEWRESPVAGIPDYLVLSRPDLELYPQPNYAYASGVRLYGFGVPGKLWNRSATEVEDSDEFPLPSWCQEAVEAWAVCLRSLQKAGKEDMVRYREYKAMFDNELRPDVEYMAGQEWSDNSL